MDEGVFAYNFNLYFFKSKKILLKVFLGNDETGVNILAYHHVVSDKEKRTYWQNNLDVMSISQFESHMRYLYEAGYTTLSLDDLYEWKHLNKEIPEKSIVITFDDGYTSLITHIQPVLNKYHFQANCFIIGAYTPEKTKEDEPGKLHYLGLDELQSGNRTFHFYSHGYELHEKNDQNQVKIKTINQDMLEIDFEKQKAITSIKYFAYPWGKQNEDLYQTFQEIGVKMAFSYGDFSPVTLSSEDYCIPRWAVLSYMSVKDLQDILKN